MKLKKGDKWTTKNYDVYTISDKGKINKTEFTDLSYEITDIKKTDIKCYLMVGFKITYIFLNNLITEYYVGSYNKKSRKVSLLETPISGDISNGLGIDNLKILSNGNLRVKFYEVSGLVYITDLQKV